MKTHGAPQSSRSIERRVAGANVWLSRAGVDATELIGGLTPRPISYEVIETEEEVGRTMLGEIEEAARRKDGDLVVIILGGRGAQALHRQLGERARAGQSDELLARLHVFTQDALAPMRMDNGFSFVRDFERLLGPDFFRKVKSFNSMRTDAGDMEEGLTAYVERLESLGGVDIFFLGMGPEAGGASHLAYIKPDSGATAVDVAGLIPISPSILEHHISKFKAGGSHVTEADEAECRAATHILTLGPATILGARRVVQSIVDASTAPGKPASYRRLRETEIGDDPAERAAQMDANPGLWLRLHDNVRSLVLPDVLTA